MSLCVFQRAANEQNPSFHCSHLPGERGEKKAAYNHLPGHIHFFISPVSWQSELWWLLLLVLHSHCYSLSLSFPNQNGPIRIQRSKTQEKPNWILYILANIFFKKSYFLISSVPNFSYVTFLDGASRSFFKKNQINLFLNL